jgi:hypothetical protein
MFSMLTEISVVPFDRQMGQTHPEQHGSPAWTYISTISLAYIIHLLKTGTAADLFICWSLILSLKEGQEKQTQSSRWGKYATECHLKLPSFCVSTGLIHWLKPFFVCRFQSVNCDMQFVKVKRVVKLVIAPIFHSSMVSVDHILIKIEDPVFL